MRRNLDRNKSKVQAVPQVRFNSQAIGYRDAPDGNVRRAVGPCAFEPVVVHKAGIEAIMEVVRFARTQGLEPPISGKRGGRW